MKKLMITLCSVFALFAATAEEPYAFRVRLECVHERDRRDVSLKAAADEFVFRDGASVAVPKGADEVLFTAAGDFTDYLNVSMGVSARVAKGGDGTVEIELDPALREREYKIEVDDDEIEIKACDSRAAAQALYHLEDLMNLRRAPYLKMGKETRRSKFSPRMTHSGWGVDMFPEGHLRQMAHAGMDAILVFVKDVHLTQRAGRQYQDVNALIRRAKKYGLDTYLYSYVVAWVHPDDPNAKQVFDSTYGRVAEAFPGAKGIVFVGESCKFPSKDERTNAEPFDVKIAKGDMRPHPGWFPCRDYPDWVRGVKAAINAKVPEMEIVFWTYNWGRCDREERMTLIDNLPKDVSLMATFEMYQNFTLSNGFKTRVGDYSVAFEGPGDYFRSEAERAKRNGLRLYTQAMAGGLTWDFGSVPFQPCPQQWKRRWDALNDSQAKWGLAGIMESHHNGWYPSFVSELEKEAYTEGGLPFDEHLRKIVARDFGEANTDAVVAVFDSWSAAARDFSPRDGNQYGPFRVGPSYPFNFGGKHIDRSEFPESPFACNGIGICFLNYTEPIWYERMYYPDQLAGEIQVMEPQVKAYDAGAEVFAKAAAGLTGRRRAKALKMANFGRYLARTVQTGLNMKRGAQAWEAKDRARLLAVARDEYVNAKAAIPLVEADSRLGWEPTMEYGGGKAQIEWKLRKMEDLYGKAALTDPFAPAKETAKETVKIMSFNVCHCEGMDGKIDIARTAARIRAEDPDFACLQEIDWRTARVSGVDEPAELARLTGLHDTFAKAIFFKGGQYGVMILSREKPLSVVQIPLPGAEARVLLVCEFKDMVVATSHLSVGAEAERKASIPLVRNAFAKYKKPVFFTGDWNARADSPVLADLREFIDVKSDVACQTFHGRTINGPDGQPLDMSKFCIDYIACDKLHAPDFEVVDAHVVDDRITSDHAPIVATFSFLRPDAHKPAFVPALVSLKLADGLYRAKAAEVTETIVSKRTTDASIPKEGYRLTVDADGISVVSLDDAGFFYALQTLKQLAEFSYGRMGFPYCTIEDAPRFGWRGMHHDDSRHFFGKAVVKRTLDLMAQHKLNVFHWHLTDDEGWRMPVAKYPKLTTVGGTRPISKNHKDLADAFEDGVYGPFAYSRGDIAEIVAYAKARHIRVVPELDVPGHCAALLRAYPEYGCFAANPSAAPHGKVDNVICLGDGRTVAMAFEVFDALAEMFPDELVHIGGDEVNKVNYRACPKCQARMKALGLKTENDLQAWFAGELAKHLAKRGKRVLGWDEIILDGQAPAGAVVMSWNGAEGGIAAANAGHEAVMTPHFACYFDYTQCLPNDPATYPWFTHPLPIEKAYSYEPLAGIPPEQHKFILGGQCCNWSEYTCNEQELQWKVWPRACATAEVFWSPPAARDFADFSVRMETHRNRLLNQGVNCAPMK